MSIRARLAEGPAVPRKEYVYSEGCFYEVHGTTDSDVFVETTLMKDEQVEKFQRHWSAFNGGEPVAKENVKRIATVHRLLQPGFWKAIEVDVPNPDEEARKKTPTVKKVVRGENKDTDYVKEEPLDVTEIVSLAKNDAKFFFSLHTACLIAMGLTEEEVLKGYDHTNEVMVGNSSTSAPVS